MDGHRYRNTRIAMGEASVLQRLRESLASGRTAGTKRTLTELTNVAEATHSSSTTVEAAATIVADSKGGGANGRATGATVESNAGRQTSHELLQPHERDAAQTSQAYSVPVPVLLLGGLQLPQDAAALPDVERRCLRLALQPNNNYASLTPVCAM